MKSSRSGRDLFRVNAITAGCLVLVAATGAAHAQAAKDKEPQQLDTVVVTGIRKGIEDAISVKKNKDNIVEAISAEDIGKLPDTTIAEALARLPGVTTQRTRDGKASTISIRGLGPDFNGYLLNGREQTSTGDSRAADLSVYPAELIAGATVYKTTDATLATAGLAGTIDNRLIDPLAFRGRVLAGSVEKNENGRGLQVVGKGNRYSLSYIDQFADRTIGVALGWVRADGTSFQQSTGGWGGASVQATLAGSGQVVQNVSVPDFGGGLDNYKNRRVSDDRTGFAAILAYKPNKNFTSQLDLFQSTITNYAKEARIQGGLGGPITNATVVNGVATKGTFQLGTSPNSLINRHESVFQDDELKSAGWRNTLKVSPALTVALDWNHNSAVRVERNIEAYGGILGTDTLTFDRTGSVPQFTLGRAAEYTNPSSVFIRDQTGWSGVNGLPQAGYSKGPTIKDKVNGVRLDLSQSMEGNPWISSLHYGLNISKRTKDRITDEGVIASVAGDGSVPFPYPSDAYVERNIGGTGFDMLTFDPKADLWPGARIIRKYNDDILSKTWGIKETVKTAYVKADLDTELMAIPVRGNVGLQVVNTNQGSTGFRANVGSGVTLSNPALTQSLATKNYTDVLPSLNLSGDLGSGNVLRMALSQQIARATLTDMRNSLALSQDLDCNNGTIVGTQCLNTSTGQIADSTYGRLVGSQGNPELKPFKAWAFDLSYEKYFGNKAYVSAAAFYKKLDSYITTRTDLAYDFTQEANALRLALPLAGSYIGQNTTTINGEGGSLRGYEIAASAPFGMFVSWLDGFGANFSYSDTSSSVNLPNLIGLNPAQPVRTGKMPLPGLSKKNAKVTIYFEKWGFSAFVAQNYRSDYVGSVAGSAIGGYPVLRYILGSSWVSAQVGYEMQSGPLKGLSLRLEGNNLNKPEYRERDENNNTTINKTGSTVILKVNYKLQ